MKTAVQSTIRMIQGLCSGSCREAAGRPLGLLTNELLHDRPAVLSTGAAMNKGNESRHREDPKGRDIPNLSSGRIGRVSIQTFRPVSNPPGRTGIIPLPETRKRIAGIPSPVPERLKIA